MSDIYILENKLKKQPHLHLHTRYQSFNSTTKNHFKILTFWHVIDDNFTKMFQTRTARTARIHVSVSLWLLLLDLANYRIGILPSTFPSLKSCLSSFDVFDVFLCLCPWLQTDSYMFLY